MIVISVDNVNDALKRGVQFFKSLETSINCQVSPRGLLTLEAPEPVTTVYAMPCERVLFSAVRDANPFFHFFESLWMLAGWNELEFLTFFNKRMAQFSDDGQTLHGAYGFRWREWFGFDQITEVIKLLQRDKDSRRGVVAMWSPNGDLVASEGAGGIDSKDVPCNTHLYFKVRRGSLHMTICNRSNDMIWGAYGANAVHMSMLHEYVADKLSVRVGVMRQISDSLHVYLDSNSSELWQKLKSVADPDNEFKDYYATGDVRPYPLTANQPGWDSDLERFMTKASLLRDVRVDQFDTDFFKNVVVPLWTAFVRRSIEALDGCLASDWHKACREWLERRKI